VGHAEKRADLVDVASLFLKHRCQKPSAVGAVVDR
jgi:hypothetical protein